MYWKYVYIIQTLILTIVVVDAQDINECSSNPCQNGGTCTDGVNSYTCGCMNGYTGLECQTDIDDCSPNPCQNGGTCTDGVNSYTCGCMDGYTGSECQTDINECSTNPCQNGGTCTDGVNSYTCGCLDGYTGLMCQSNINECVSLPCQNGGSCVDGVNMYTCDCLDGFNGAECQTNIDECFPNPCQNGGTCTDGVNSYTCECMDGYTGLECETDINECSSSPCENGGTCTDSVDSYMCGCVDGYTGLECQTDIDECSPNPCQNGGTCTDGVNSYVCGCMDGYTGLECETDVDECVDTPCSNGGSCSNTLGSFSCECVPGYAGSICDSEIDECSSNPCQNGATCVDAVNMYTCTCVAGYVGQNCDTDVNECLSSPCMNGAACTDEVNGYTCQCAAGYTGTTCSVDIDECASDPCGNNGVCTDLVNGFTCQCGPGYTDVTCRESMIGDTCADRIDVCSGLNHATCTDGTCQCLPGYSVTASGVCDIISSQFAVQCIITAQCTTIDSACRLDSDDVTRCMCPVSGKSFYVAAADTCVSVATVTFGGVCIADIQCMTSNSTCYDIGGTGSTVCACPSVIYTYHDSAVDECLSDCGGLSAPTNGLVQLPEHTVAGQTATYTCHVGYALSGNDVRICTSAGGWSGDTPLCLVGCATPDPPTNGYVNVTSRLVGGVASYNCGEGYVLVGNTHRACQADSQWAGNTPECKRECLILTAIPHGAVDDSAGTWEGSVATYVCMDSYTLKGAASRMCLASGRWSGVEPSCTDATFPTQLNLILGSLLLVAALVLLFIGGVLAYNRCIKPRYKKEASEAESAVEFAELSGGASQEGMVPPSDTRRQWKVKNAQIVPEDEDGDTAHPPPSMKQRALPFDRSRFRFMNAVREPMKETFTNPSKIVDPTLGNGELLRKILKSEAGTTSDDVDKKSPLESDGVPSMTDLTQLNSTAQPVIDGPRGRSKSPHPIANDNHLDRFKSQERQLNNFKGALKAYKS